MATATRVKQDRKYTPILERVMEYTRVVVDRGGVVRSSDIVDSRLVTVQKDTWTDQPDRIHLEMSVEEAQQVQRILGCAKLWTTSGSVWAVLRGVLGSSVTEAISGLGGDADCALPGTAASSQAGTSDCAPTKAVRPSTI